MAPSTALSRCSHGRGSHRARRTGSKAETPTLYPVRTSHTGGAKCPGEGHSGDGTLTLSEADRLPIARAHRGGGPRAGQEVEACGVRPQEENRRAGVQGCRGTDTKTHSVHNSQQHAGPSPPSAAAGSSAGASRGREMSRPSTMQFVKNSRCHSKWLLSIRGIPDQRQLQSKARH